MELSIHKKSLVLRTDYFVRREDHRSRTRKSYFSVVLFSSSFFFLFSPPPENRKEEIDYVLGL